MHGERQNEGMTGRAAQGNDSRCSRQQVSLDNVPSDLMNFGNVHLSAAEDVQTAVQQGNEGGRPKSPCFVTEFAGISRRLAKLKDRSAALQLARVLRSVRPTYFKKIMENPKECEGSRLKV